MTNEPVPQRLSDADRDQAVDCLRQHYEAGRLSDAEFEERSGRALEARIAPDIDALFGDLPDPRPSLGDVSGPYGSPASPSFGSTSPYAPTPWSQNSVPGTSSYTPGPYPPARGASSPYGQGGPPAPYTPGGAPAPYGQQGGVPQKAGQDWIRTGRLVLWPAVILAGLIFGDLTMWIIIGVVLTIVLSQVSSRTRRPPPY